MSETSDTPTQPEPQPEHQPQPQGQAREGRRGKDPLRGSRTSGVWFAVVALAVLLLLLIVFIAQNTEQVKVSFFGFDGQAPLAVTILISVLVGLLLAVVAGTLRILQLRRRVRGHR